MSNNDVTQTRQPDGSSLESHCFLDYPIDEVFAFFKTLQLAVLTPEFLRFEVLTPKPIEMAAGALIDYRIRELKWAPRSPTGTRRTLRRPAPRGRTVSGTHP